MTEGFDSETNRLLKKLDRTDLQRIWFDAQLGLPLNDEDTRMAKIMREHREYHDLWSHLSELDDEQIVRDGVNPLLHINTHLVVENQIAENNPPEVAGIVDGLNKKGYTRHQAIHAVASVILSEILDMLKNQRLFDRKRYLRELRKIPSKLK